MKPMSIALVVVALFAAGVGGGYFFVMQQSGQKAADVSPAGDATNAGGASHDQDQDHGPAEHGKAVKIPENPTICGPHRIPEVACPFCTPSLVEELGYCGGHNVAEALCTRCNPVLIAAFKAEGDWCAEHGLPESQCLACNPKPEG